jgi:hypothetical protein
MAEFIVNIEGGDISKINELTNSLSAASQRLKQDKKIVKVTHDGINANTFWGNPKWLDASGKIISGHEFNKTQIEKKNKSTIDF